MPIKRTKKPAVTAPGKPNPSSEAGLEVVMIPVEDLIPDDDNPNQMDEATFDQLVEEIREQGFDEPLLVRKSATLAGKYEIGSGHHRTKAAMVLGLTSLPCVVKNWTDREQKAALTKRNVLRGSLDKGKLRKLYEDLVKDHDPAVVQRELGFTDQKAFELMIDQVSKSLPPKQKKKLAEAKEKIKSIDDLSSVLNRIFKESGSEVDEGYLVFSFGGRNHHYFQIDAATEDKLQAILGACDNAGITYRDFVAAIIAAAELPKPTPGGRKTASKRPIRKKKR